ncbi:Fe(3+) ABC transporter substrate-binding protein [Caenispirillum bisanense]|uniref:Fe(3+) ABC transporter substrate-binding protein n=1 Tax=Caenispirillum bisanense TaxID=414052 RepID=UPI0031CE2739
MTRTLRSFSRLAVAAVALAAPAALFAADADAAEVNLYSARKEELIRPMLDEFTKETGIKVNVLTADADQLVERIKSEGANSPADVLMTVDAGRLYRAKQEGILQAIDSQVLEAAVPAHLQDKDNEWFGLSQRARVVFYAKDRVKPEELSTYEDLASDKWKGRICIRSSGNIYNLSMMAAMIAHHGEEKAKEWADGMVNNLARAPQGGDRDQIKAVAAGECDLAISNTYYVVGMLASKDEAEAKAAQAVSVFFPNQQTTGTHVNVSGAGVVKNAPNKADAVKLLEWLAGEKAQAMYAEVNGEYPVVAGVPWGETLKAWGEFKMDELPMDNLGEYNAAATKVFDQTGWR